MIRLNYPIKSYPEPFQSMATINGTKPFKPIITQGFGDNGAPFYKQLRMLGHNGIDFVAPHGLPIYATHDGVVTKVWDEANSSPTIGYGIWLTHAEGWTTVYFHLLKVRPVKLGSEFKAGELMTKADNTGQYTTGDHLHLGLYPANPDKNNGYGGAMNPLLYFTLNQLTENNMVDEKKLVQIYNEILFRNPDLLAVPYIGQEEDKVRAEIGMSEERQKLIQLINIAKQVK